MRDDFLSRSFSDISAPRSGFSDMAISPLESLVLACALEEARSQSQDAMDQYEMNPLDYERLMELPGNHHCADCGAEDTEWSSVTFGVFLCAHCSGIHRAMGTHISRVRSVKMDSWSPEHLRRMECGGNDQCNAVLSTNQDPQDPVSAEALKDKYSSKAAQDYKLLMDERVKEGAVSTCTHTHAISRPSGEQRRTSIKAPRRLPPRNKSSPSALTGRTRTNPFTNATSSTTAIAASAPTIVYMGRTFAADSVQPPTSKAQRRATMATSTMTPDPQRELRAFLEPEMQPFFFDQQDILDITSNQSEFARLKKSLKNKGAITNQLIKQKMHIFVLNRKKRMADHHGGDAQDLERSVSVLTQVA